MPEGLLVGALFVLFLLYRGLKALFRLLSGEMRREREQEERLRQAEAEFNSAILQGRFPSDAVLTLLKDRESFTDDHGYHDHTIPEDVWEHTPYLKDEWYSICSYARAVRLVREEQSRLAKLAQQKTIVIREREKANSVYGSISHDFADMLSRCQRPYEEVCRASTALGGANTSNALTDVIGHDLRTLLKAVSVASGALPNEFGQLYQVIYSRLEPETYQTVEECVRYVRNQDQESICSPVLLTHMNKYDRLSHENISTAVASVYSNFLDTALQCVPKSVASEAVKAKYSYMFAPFLTQHQQTISPSPAGSMSSSPRGGFACIAGMDSLKRQLHDEVVEVFKQSEKYAKYGIFLPNGILLFGPPGCGKTYVARQLAAEIDCSFIEVAPSDLGSTYAHGSALKIREMFDSAAAKAPCVLFIDEFDAVVPSRGSVGGGSHWKIEEINEFLSRLEGCAKKKILIVAATNRPDEIDPAILRTGRFDKTIYIALPDQTARAEMLDFHLKGRPVVPEIDKVGVASELENYSASDIKELVVQAARLALQMDRPITTGDLHEAQKALHPRISTADLRKFDQFAGAAKVTRLGFQPERGN